MDPMAAAVFHVMFHHFPFHPVVHLHVMVHQIRVHTAGVSHHGHMMDRHLRDVLRNVMDVFRLFGNVLRHFWNILRHFG